MAARIYEVVKSATQSGRGHEGNWRLEFVPAEAKRPDALMGWAGSGDVNQQIRLSFDSRSDAEAYADRYGITAHVIAATPRRLKIQAYADNFR